MIYQNIDIPLQCKVTNNHPNTQKAMDTIGKKIQDDAVPALTQLREMKVGEELTFPAERSSYISSISTRFGFQWDKKFRTRVNKADRTISVTRTK